MKFVYHGEIYDGYDSAYNTTIENERAIEIPIVRRWLRRRDGLGLEVGNVLAWYGGPRRRVVDLYEEAPNVENIDVLAITGSFDWIVCISTLEHVRWDDEPTDPQGALDALDHLVGLLSPAGHMLVTVPGGHHPVLDAHLATGAGAARWCTMAREGGTWIQTPSPEFRPYSMETKAASVWIGEW